MKNIVSRDENKQTRISAKCGGRGRRWSEASEASKETAVTLAENWQAKNRPREFDHHWLKLFAFTAPTQQFGLSGEFDG